MCPLQSGQSVTWLWSGQLQTRTGEHGPRSPSLLVWRYQMMLPRMSASTGHLGGPGTKGRCLHTPVRMSPHVNDFCSKSLMIGASPWSPCKCCSSADQSSGLPRIRHFLPSLSVCNNWGLINCFTRCLWCCLRVESIWFISPSPGKKVTCGRSPGAGAPPSASSPQSLRPWPSSAVCTEASERRAGLLLVTRPKIPFSQPECHTALG